MKRALLLAALVLSFVASAASAQSGDAPPPRSGFRALPKREAAAFRLPGDVAKVTEFASARYGLTIARYRQVVGGAEVQGGQLTVWRDAAGRQVAVIGSHYPGLRPRNIRKLQAADAVAVAHTRSGARGRTLSELKLDPASGRLFYRVETERPDERPVLWIDASDGRVLKSYDAMPTHAESVSHEATGSKGEAKRIETVFEDGTHRMASGPAGLARQTTYDSRGLAEGEDPSGNELTDVEGVWGEPNPVQPPDKQLERSGVDAHSFAKVVDDYYLARGFDLTAPGRLGAAGMRSRVHHGVNFANAKWTGNPTTGVLYGDGGAAYHPWSRGLDMVAHEWTHAVTQYTSGLEYFGETGALNESFSDIMGTAIEFWANTRDVDRDPSAVADWQVGEDFDPAPPSPQQPAPGIRNMAIPGEDAQPDHLTELQETLSRGDANDNGSVHTNSGIPNHAFYLLAQPGGAQSRNAGETDPQGPYEHLHTGPAVTGIGWEKASDIFFLAFASLPEDFPPMPAGGVFLEARRATLAAANVLHSDDPQPSASVAAAWDAVGVIDEPSCSGDVGLIGNTVAVDQARAVEITEPGKCAVLFFEGQQGQRVNLEFSDITMGTFTAAIHRGPGGRNDAVLAPTRIVPSSSAPATITEPVDLPRTEVYKIKIDPDVGNVGRATVTLRTVAPDRSEPITRVGLPNGGPKTITVRDPGQKYELTFEREREGQHVSLAITEQAFPIGVVSIRDPDGNPLRDVNGQLLEKRQVDRPGGFFDKALLPSPGRYTIRVDPYQMGTGNATLTLYDVQDRTGAIAMGQTVPVPLATPGQNGRLTFRGVAGQSVSVEFSGVTIPHSTVSITGPGGSTLVAPLHTYTSGEFTDAVAIEVDGDYTILIDPVDANVGELDVTLHEVVDVVRTIAVGDTVALHMGTPGQNGVATFAGAAGQDVSVSVRDVTICCWGADVYLLGADGERLLHLWPVEAPGAAGATRLPYTGTYTIRVDPDYTSTGGATLRLEPVNSLAWGYNGSGRLGTGDTMSRASARPVALLADTLTVSGGGGHSLALRSDGTVWAWGTGAWGELGTGSTQDSLTAKKVAGLSGIVALASGEDHNLALDSNGSVWTWGRNDIGQLGGPSDSSCTGGGVPAQCRLVPARVQGLTDVVAIGAGRHHSLVVKRAGTVWAWGSNQYGQLGNGTATNQPTPVQVSGITDAVAAAGGWYHSLALSSDGTVKAWGRNLYGQLGNGATTDSRVPVQTSGLSGATAIGAGQFHSLAATGGGPVRAWGRNHRGQLGDGTTTNRTTSAPVTGTADVVALAAGADHSLALGRDGSILAWGYNYYGQLGNGATTNSASPVRASGVVGAKAIAAGWYHSLAVER